MKMKPLKASLFMDKISFTVLTLALLAAMPVAAISTIAQSF